MRKVRHVIKHAAEVTSDMNKNISIRMTQFYVFSMLCWMMFNFVAGFVAHVDKPIIKYFGLLLLTFFSLLFIGYLFDVEQYMVYILDFFVLGFTPVSWYVCGGTTSSSVNSMYIMSIVYFCLCSYGSMRVFGTVVSIMEVAGVTIITKRFPEAAMPPYAPGKSILTCNSLIGFSTTMVIVALLFRQIREYRLENERSEAYKNELRESNALQKKFLANMSHEIRSPLGIVLGFNDLIAKSDDIDEIREYSSNISTAGETLKVVINDILDYSKIESGKLDIIEVDYSLRKLLNDIDKNIRLKASEKGLKLSITVGDGIPDMLYGDDVRIKQCLINVLSNAVKYTESGSVDFIVSGEIDKDDETRCNLRFLCKDTGKGIAKDAIPHLFTAFERVDEGKNRKIEGTGLGLAITKSLVDEMNGEISVESEVNKGSEFLISISQKISNKQSDSAHETSDINLENVKVAVVDDTKPNLVLCRKLLEIVGANVETYNSGEEFLKACEMNQYDILLIDHMMPGMDGLQVLSELKKDNGLNAETPRFVFTANAMAGAEKEYIDFGFNGFISKPINKEEFVSKIYNVVR